MFFFDISLLITMSPFNRTGLRNNICLTLVVLASWSMASLSVNIYSHVYQTAFAVCSALQVSSISQPTRALIGQYTLRRHRLECIYQ
jgi:hypothetical protein